MDLHQNARLTFRSREALAKKIMIERLTLNAAAAAFNVSRKTAAKWWTRYRTLGGARLAGSFLLSAAQPAPNLVGVDRPGHCPAARVAPCLSDRPSHPPQPRHHQPHSAAGSSQPLAPPASRSSRRALRASCPWRSAAPRHQGHDPLSASFHSWRWPPPRPPPVRRLAGSARCHRRSLPPRLLPHAAQPTKRNRHRLPARRCRLLRPTRHHHSPTAHRQRLLLSLPPLPHCLPPTRHPAPLYPSLHAAHQRQGRTLHPNRPARVGLRSPLPQLRRT